MFWHANPDEETTDWRAVCGRTARNEEASQHIQAQVDRYWANVHATTGAAR